MSAIKAISWKSGFPNRGVDAKAAHAALEKIRKANDGKLDPAVVVAAIGKRHVLRNLFEWDDVAAGAEYRLEQARRLLRSVQIIYADAPTIPTRAYELTVEPAVEAKAKRLYRAAADVLKDPDSRADLLKRAMGELVSFQRRFRGLQELAVIFRAVDEVLTSIDA